MLGNPLIPWGDNIASESKTKSVNSFLEFCWVCPDTDCRRINRISWDQWTSRTDGIDECRECEHAYKVRVPWG